MPNWKTMLALGAVIVAVAGCRDVADEPLMVYDPTPVTLAIPDHATIYLGAMPQAPDNPLTAEGIALGRKLFYEEMLSDDQTMSCASCHKQASAFDDPRRFSQGTNGALGDRNAMSIVNLGWSPSLFWDGRRNSLEAQAHDPVSNPIEMRGHWPTIERRLQASPTYPSLFFAAFGTNDIDSLLVTKAIAQFERSMLSFDSPFDSFFYWGDTTVLNASQKRGFALYFGDAECIHCHSGPLLTDNLLKNNGLDASPFDLGYGIVTGNSADNGKFRVPTLRNIALTAPYMHDGRFATLEQVIEHYNSQVEASSPNLDPEMHAYTPGLHLTNQQKEDLIRFLQSFTDQSFVSNPQFSDPQ